MPAFDLEKLPLPKLLKERMPHPGNKGEKSHTIEKVMFGAFVLVCLALRYWFSGYHERNRYIKPKVPPPGGFSKTKFTYGASNIPWDKERFETGHDGWLAQDNLLWVAYAGRSWPSRDWNYFVRKLLGDFKMKYDEDPAMDLKDAMNHAMWLNPMIK